MPNNWNVIGHHWALNLLHGQILNNKLRHAYLFTGPAGIGKRTLALKVAQAVNCENAPDTGEICHDCRACRGLSKMTHTDLHIVQRLEGDRQIKVEAVRELSRMLALTPYESKFQIALLLNFEQATEQAANALLKTLEEPADRVILLLTAESAESLPATIASRCEVLRLRPLAADLLESSLMEKDGFDEERARFLAHISGGRPGFALQLAENPDYLLMRNEWVQEASDLLGKGNVGRFSFADRASKDRDQLQKMLEVWLSFWRDVLIRASLAEASIANVDHGAEISSLARTLGSETSQKIVAALQESITVLKGNANARLTLETLLLKIPKMSSS